MDHLRIEISTGIFGGVNQTQKELDEMCCRLEETVEELEAVRREMAVLPANLRHMNDAREQLDIRIAQEREKLGQAMVFRDQSDEFFRNVVSVDKQVAGSLNKGRKAVEKTKKKGLGQRFADGWNRFWGAAMDLGEKGLEFVKSAANSANEWRKSVWEYLGRSLEHFILGEYSDEKVTIGSLVGNIAASIFGVDFPCDIRDGIYHITHWDEMENPWGTIALDVVALIPLIGAVKYLKYSDEVVDGIKVAGDFVDGIHDTAKNVDRAGDVVDAATDTADALGDTGELIWETARHRKYIMDDGSFKVLDDSGNVIRRVDNVECIEEFHYVKKTPEALAEARSHFNNVTKKEFLEKLVNEQADTLRGLGLDEDDFELMRAGYVPEGFEIHHKLPLDDSGTNDLDNLILIDTESHKLFSGYQNTFTRTGAFRANGEAEVFWVVPSGSIYIP